MEYVIRRAKSKPQLAGKWDVKPWTDAEIAHIKIFHERSSDHHPTTHARFLFDDAGLYAQFRVQDQYVRSVQTEYQSHVCTDSCVEAFLEPKAGLGYFNFEVNCGGMLLCYYIEDPKVTVPKKGFDKWTKIPEEMLRTVKIYHSMPAVVKPEIKEPVEWRIEYFVPNEFFEHFVGPLGPAEARRWRGNFYKCGDKTSHPHWGSWSTIGPRLNFHQPDFFAPIRFETKLRATVRRRTSARPAVQLQLG